MTTKTLRKIVHIDEERCNGCGACVTACAEGALRIIDGKARLVSETYCDGLGACLGECPQGAITVEDRVAEEFDEASVKYHLEETERGDETLVRFERQEPTVDSIPRQSMLGQWPVKLSLVPPRAPFLQGADLMLVADCVPFAYAGFHQDFLRGHALLVACPKLDNFQAHQEKLTEILRQSPVKSITVVHMEVPCCSGLVHMTKQAIMKSGKDIPLREVTIGIKGDVKSH